MIDDVSIARPFVILEEDGGRGGGGGGGGGGGEGGEEDDDDGGGGGDGGFTKEAFTKDSLCLGPLIAFTRRTGSILTGFVVAPALLREEDVTEDGENRGKNPSVFLFYQATKQPPTQNSNPTVLNLLNVFFLAYN
ncbi:hypothetical protein HZH66_008538 [Vespula vulgaris]|uniref:Uncharacterized protein n=1 Tax=Vespula vulgaris TaxID=7454 RepID=A0A834N1T9_VESVU|nr:hypothetical protein HZH66_008538 [Vespula vulgaris]